MRTLILALSTLALGGAVMAAETSGCIAGFANGGAQIVVTSLATGEVSGFMAKCDGTYRAEPLKPGRYQIVEGGPNHAVRTVGVDAGKESQVDLAAESRRTKCQAKKDGK
ncbi:carboxypeptidase-like regulatory domain-containing protein [Duganella aceris]|uniref:Carboxypeptidase regulatory-like domain-containing protein n=1 Tax=Duganella aceris TaxID=2703883 RepID=A0ABX0FLQ6_9BURK|nr:carboxypeptidase-like regulatory domain-containing protein [Duganella aceris]NGZ85541.1 carboxypeptidase regulatory-like domain-containing protein [Duganella aceris]